MWKILSQKTDKSISFQELEKMNSGRLSAKVANNRFDRMHCDDWHFRVGHGLDFLFPLRSCLSRQHQPNLRSASDFGLGLATLEEQDRRRRYRRTSKTDRQTSMDLVGLGWVAKIRKMKWRHRERSIIIFTNIVKNKGVSGTIKAFADVTKWR